MDPSAPFSSKLNRIKSRTCGIAICWYHILTIEEYKVCQYSARCDSNLLRNRASRLLLIPFAIKDSILGGWDILITDG